MNTFKKKAGQFLERRFDWVAWIALAIIVLVALMLLQ